MHVSLTHSDKILGKKQLEGGAALFWLTEGTIHNGGNMALEMVLGYVSTGMRCLFTY